MVSSGSRLVAPLVAPPCGVDLFNGRSSSRILQNWEEDLDATSIAPRCFQICRKAKRSSAVHIDQGMTWGEILDLGWICKIYENIGLDEISSLQLR